MMNGTTTLATGSATADEIYQHHSDDPNCDSCHQVFSQNEIAISCFICKKWSHITCVNITKTKYEIIQKLHDQVEWFCINCISLKSTLRLPGIIDNPGSSNMGTDCKPGSPNMGTDCKPESSLGSLSKSLFTVQQELAAQTTLIQSISNNILNLKGERQPFQKPTNPSNYKNALIPKRNNFQLHTANKFETKTVDPTLTLVLTHATEKTKCENKHTFLSELSKLFPEIKLTNSSRKPNGLIFMNFQTNEDANRVHNGWKPTFFGTSTKIYFLRSGNNRVVLHNVGTQIYQHQR